MGVAEFKGRLRPRPRARPTTTKLMRKGCRLVLMPVLTKSESNPRKLLNRPFRERGRARGRGRRRFGEFGFVVRPLEVL